MSIRYLIAAALMASACAAHADVIPSAGGPGIVNGSNVAGAVGDSSVIAGVSRAAGSDALVQALYQKVSASVGSDMKVSLKQGIDGVYVTGLSTAKAAALAGDGMSVVSTADGFKIVANTPAAGTAGGGANTGNMGGGNGGGNGAIGGGGAIPDGIVTGPGTGLGNLGGNGNGNIPADVGIGAGGNLGNNAGGSADVGIGNGNGNGVGNGNGNGNGSQQDTAEVPEPSTVALMLAGLLGVAGLGRRRAR